MSDKHVNYESKIMNAENTNVIKESQRSNNRASIYDKDNDNSNNTTNNNNNEKTILKEKHLSYNSYLLRKIHISERNKYKISKTNFSAFLSTLLQYILFDNISNKADFAYTNCNIMYYRATQITRIYFYLTLCYFISILSNFIENYVHQSVLYNIISTIFSFVATSAQIFTEIIFFILIGMSLFENEKCGFLRIFTIIWMIFTTASLLSYVYIILKGLISIKEKSNFKISSRGDYNNGYNKTRSHSSSEEKKNYYINV